jgi:hypothetical protein
VNTHLVHTGMTFLSQTVGSLAACQAYCDTSAGCSLIVYTTNTGLCEIKARLISDRIIQ